MTSRERLVYRVFNFSLIALIVLIFSVALTPALGVAGFLIPLVLVGTATMLVCAGLDGLIYLIESVERLLARRPILRSNDIHRFDYVAAPKMQRDDSREQDPSDQAR